MTGALLTVLAVLTANTVVSVRADVIISEIMYHPVSEDVREEFIELHNRGPASVPLGGWQFTSGIRFTLPAVTLGPGQYLVIAANTAVFQAKYPSVANVVGNWEGTLSNSDEDIDFDDPTGRTEDSVHYANEGDWAVRARGALDNNHQGWIWVAPHDGGGKSLELINLVLSNNEGQNWASSLSHGGTPGQVNSAHRLNIAPLILEGTHFPVVPSSSQTVSVTAQVVDEQTSGVVVNVYHRAGSAAGFSMTQMFDDGSHNDGLTGDGYFGAVLPLQPNHTVVEFYFEARDASGNTRTWPGPVQPTGTQAANLLYQVNNAVDPGTQPLYRLIMTETERRELDYIGDTLPDALSDAQMNGTFISVDESGVRLRYNVGIRNRGNGSRTYRPNNYHIDFPNDRRWKGVRAINLNTQFPHAQLVGSLIMSRAGVPVADAQPVHVTVNNTNLARAGTPQFGSYIAVESLNSDFADDHFAGDSSGNLYRGKANSAAHTEADLYHRGTNPNSYRTNYNKETNASEEKWADIIELTRVFSDTPTNTYASELNRVLDVDEWLRYFAVNALFDNNETGIYMGYGDDYGLYFGRNDPHALLLAHDHDTIMGQGDSPGRANADIFRATALSNVERFLKGPEFGPLYYAHLRGLIRTIFSEEQLHPLLDENLSSYVPAATITQMKNFAAARNNHVLGLLPDLIPIGATWKYEQSGTDLGTGWRASGFNDAAWLSGPALFYNESATLPAPKRTRLDLNGQTIYYFRTRFNLPPGLGPNLASLSLELGTILDDGAVIYLNGQEILRLGMPDGPVSYGTLASRAIGDAIWERPLEVAGNLLVAGENLLAVELHQTDPTSSDMVFGMTLNLIARPNTVPPSRVVLHEILARSATSNAPSWIELYNRSSSSIDMSGTSLSDNFALPDKWLFPTGTVIPGFGFLVVRADGFLPPTTNNTGFTLKPNGDDLYFFDTAARGRALLDSIEFGLQATGFGIGRVPSGTGNNWSLTSPTSGAANIPAQLGNNRTLKVNEWMVAPSIGDDWFEVFNPDLKPVTVTGCYLSDNLNNRTDYRVPALSFIGTGAAAYQKFIADSQTSKGAQHVDFKLSAGGESIVIFDANGLMLDAVHFGTQQVDVAQGRLPDGSANMISFGAATPGAPNVAGPALLIFKSNGQVYIRFTATAGRSYTLQVSDSTINGGAWATARQIPPAGSTMVVDSSDFILPGKRTRIYRLLQSP